MPLNSAPNTLGAHGVIMIRNPLFIAIASAILSACASAPEQSIEPSPSRPAPVKSEEVLPQNDLASRPENEFKTVVASDEATPKTTAARTDREEPPITGHRWTTLEFKDQKSLVDALDEVGLSLGKVVSPSETDAVVNSETLRGELVTIISDEEGVVLSLYGKTEAGDVISLVNADGSFVLSKESGPIMEPVIRLSVTPRSSMKSLGLTQKLALKQALTGKDKDEVQSILANERLDISFKALFVQGRMVGPISIESIERFN